MSVAMTAGFRRLAEDEAGCPVSAGARVGHVADARVLSVDLSGVPEARRADVVSAIRDLVGKAQAHTPDAPAVRFG